LVASQLRKQHEVERRTVGCPVVRIMCPCVGTCPSMDYCSMGCTMNTQPSVFW